MARSLTKIKHHPVASTTSEILWFRSLLHELGVALPEQSIICYDNVRITYLCVDPIFHF